MAREPQGSRRIGAPTLDMAGTFLIRQEQKFGCRELSKTTSSCRDPATEANASLRRHNSQLCQELGVGARRTTLTVMPGQTTSPDYFSKILKSDALSVLRKNEHGPSLVQ